MNRIILIGNGFDLAHGLKTSYNNFIDDYWNNTIIKIRKNRFDLNYEDEDLIVNNNQGIWRSTETYEGLKEDIKRNKGSITFKNIFLRRITEKKHLQKWVDIENEYYELLKESMNQSNPYDISTLNKDFTRIKELLESYLKKIENQINTSNDRLRETIGSKIYSDCKNVDFTEISREFFDPIKMNLETNIIPVNFLFLSFNYTRTESHYWDHNLFCNDTNNLRKDIIHIHGLLYTKKNPIIFGFGDEIGDDYKQIENINNNEYLRNIKSINYLETSNYKKLLDFINDGKFQIFIFGHSCGISDRTLLNTLFEHENCCSIKPFYHQINETEDNYIDIVSNISRNFNDKKAMRDKVVNKEFCEPLS